MSCVVQKTAVRGRFLDIKNTVSQAAQILDQVRYIEDGLLITEQGNEPYRVCRRLFYLS